MGDLVKVDDQQALAPIVHYFDKRKYNPIMYTRNLLADLPAGVKLTPVELELSERDFWFKKELPSLKDGEAMPKSTTWSKIADVFNIELERITERTFQSTKMDRYGKEIPCLILFIEYRARFMRPDGTIKTATGGKEEEYTPGRNHSREKIDTKAKRNAIRAVLDGELTWTEQTAKLPVVAFRASFERGYQVDHVVAAIEASREQAINRLYGSTDPVVDVHSEEADAAHNETLESLASEMAQAKTIAELEHIGSAVALLELSPEDKKWLKDKYIEALGRLKSQDGASNEVLY